MKTELNNLALFLSGENKNKSIIFVHGFPFDHYMWDEQVEELSKDFYCIAFDIRGLGESPAGDGQFTIESFVDDLENIIDGLELKKPVLCGLSMGGYISLRAVERMENKFSAVILCDTKSLPDNDEGKIKRADGVKMINNKGIEDFVNQFVPNCFSERFIREHKPEYERVLSRSKNSNAIGVKGCLLAMAARTDTSSYLSKISIPTLIICGTEDKLTPLEVMKSMAAKIKNSKYISVEGAGHMTPVEKPGIVNKAIKEFLKTDN